MTNTECRHFPMKCDGSGSCYCGCGCVTDPHPSMPYDGHNLCRESDRAYMKQLEAKDADLAALRKRLEEATEALESALGHIEGCCDMEMPSEKQVLYELKAHLGAQADRDGRGEEMA